VAAPGEIKLPAPSANDHIAIAGAQALRWQQGSYDCWVLRGGCSIRQGKLHARGDEAMLLIEHGEQYGNTPTKLIVYFEGKVTVDHEAPDTPQGAAKPSKLVDTSWFGRLHTFAPLQFDVPAPAAAPQQKPPVFERGMARLDPNWQRRRDDKVKPAQFTEFGPGQVATEPLPAGTRRIRAFPRSDVRVQAQWFPSAGGNEWVAIIGSGVNLIIDNIGGRSIDISTDRMVIWTAGGQPDLTGETLDNDDRPLEIYMEGNIIFREGERVIYAQRMYYDATRKTGIVLDAEVLTPVPSYQGLLRLKADIVRQINPDRFLAYDSQVTTSRLGEPRYYLYSNEVAFDDVQTPLVDP
jgi:hypothetical protein